MDSVTQLVLGASVGHAAGGKDAGKKAVVAGAIGGTIPDLDILFYPFLDSIQQLGFHRGISHSFLFVIVASPVFGWLAHKISRKSDVPLSVWTRIGFWALLTHILLDSFTVYGTGLFEPFSRYRAAFNSIFIIDPLYTLPLVVGLLPALFGRATGSTARAFTSAGLVLSTLYLVWTLGAKSAADRAFKAELERMDVAYSRVMTAPTAFNSVLWRALVETEDEFLEAYYSLVSGNEPDFRAIERTAALPSSLQSAPAVETVKWFSKDFYVVEKRGEAFLMHDLRFGTVGFYDDQFVFTFEILDTETGGGTALRHVPVSFDGFDAAMSRLWRMIVGRT